MTEQSGEVPVNLVPEEVKPTKRYSYTGILKADESGKISRRGFLTGLGVGAVGLAGLKFWPRGGGDKAVNQPVPEVSTSSEAENSTRIVISPELQAQLKPEGTDTVTKAFHDYITAYGSKHPEIRFEVGDFSDQTKTAAGGVKSTVLEQADPGVVYFDVNALTQNKGDVDLQQQFRNTTLHSLTHANKPDEPTILDTPILLKDGAQIYGSKDLIFLINLPNGED